MTEVQTELGNKSLTESENEYLYMKSYLIMLKYGRMFDRVIIKNESKFIKKDKSFRKSKWIEDITKEFFKIGFRDLESTYFKIKLLIEQEKLPLSDTYVRTRLKKLFDENYTFKQHTHLTNMYFTYDIDVVRKSFLNSIESGEYGLMKKYKYSDNWERVFKL